MAGVFCHAGFGTGGAAEQGARSWAAWNAGEARTDFANKKPRKNAAGGAAPSFHARRPVAKTFPVLFSNKNQLFLKLFIQKDAPPSSPPPAA
jgi:hypothetical protein